MKITSLLVLVLLFSGCTTVKEKYIYLKTPCPKFEYKTNGVEFIDYNDTHALISHEDVKDIVTFSKERDEFNSYIDKLNTKE